MALHDFERLDAGRARVRVMADLVQDLRAFGFAQFERYELDCSNPVGRAHRSTSDMTKSIDAMYATRSGTICPRITLGICCRWAKLGVRIRVR